MRTRWAALALILLLCTACQQNARASLQPEAQATDVASDARAAMARRDWSAAAVLFRQAIPSAPDGVALHYGLAISATYLDLRDEALREFHWVLEHATPGSEEATVARTWLTQTGGQTARAAATERPVTEGDGSDAKSGSSGVRGIVRWAEPGQPAEQPLNRKLLHLVGLKNTATSGLRYNIRSDENGRYEFTNIVAGSYKLTDAIAGEPMWRLKITVPKAQETDVDLELNNSAKVRDDFPEPGPS